MEERKQKKTRAKSTPSVKAEQDAVEGDEPQRKPRKKRPQPLGEEAAESQLAEGKPKKKKKKVEVVKEEPEENFGTDVNAVKDEKKTTPEKEDATSLYEDAIGTAPSYFGSNPMQEFRPPTHTGITELPVKDFFLITLLWLPRLFGPWISAWHEFNVFILARPDHLEAKKNELLKVDLIVFGVSCLVSILVSIIADLASMRYYVYLILLLLYTLCPVAGGYVDVVLRSRMYDKELYNHWFSSLVLMRAAMAIPVIFFPVQFTCIFTEKANMSRQAHYNWIAFFAFFEFVNAYVAFWVIPGKCPTTEWTQIVVWVGILALLYLLIVLTLTFSIIVKSMRYTLLTCLKTCGLDPEKYLSNSYNEKIFKDRIPKNLRFQKLQWFGFMLIPLVFSSFVFATLERFVPDEDWDKHYVLSATSMFYLGRILGVMLMVVVLYFIRHGFKRVLQIPIFRGDVLVLGLPHLFNILALMTLVGRFATLSNLSPGDVIEGPIPDDNKTVVWFFNQMFRNKTVCVRADYFRPVKVRAFHHAAREIYDPGVNKINFSLIPEPGANPVVATNFVLNHFEKNRWIIYSINLFTYLNRDALENETRYREYMNKPRVLRHHLANQAEYHPEGGPGVILINNFYSEFKRVCRLIEARRCRPFFTQRPIPPRPRPTTTTKPPPKLSCTKENVVYYLLRYEEPPTPSVYTKKLLMGREDIASFYRPPKLGTWYIAAGVDLSNKITVSPPVPFNVSNHTLYVASWYIIAPMDPKYEEERQLDLVRSKVFRIAEIAGPDSHRLPSKKVLQRDWAIQMGLTLAGMSAGGLFVGIVYLFWMDPPFPSWQTTALAVFWTLMIGAAESPNVKLVDVGLIVSSVLLVIQILFTCLHVLASMNLYTPDFNFRKRPD